MASPADQKLLELLEKWLTSLELHAKYAALDDERYWQIQPWKEHERPSGWIIDLAMQKTIALKARVEERIARGDAQFCESLELMLFLANLVGAEHIERFIPMAEAHNERAATLPKTTPPAAASNKADDDSATGTREMPMMLLGERSAPPLADSNERVARVERRAAAASQSAANSAGRARGAPAQGGQPPGAVARGGQPRGGLPRGGLPPQAAHEAQTPGAPPLNAHEQVISDAVRLVQWGRKWFELPELIARMAGRPPLAEVRRILKENKLAIDAKSVKP